MSSLPSNPQPTVAFARQLTQPPGKLYLLHGEDSAFHLSHTIASAALARGIRIAVADGGNWFNVHTIINFARAARYNPDEFLRRIFVSRSFTCYQMEQTITRLLPAFLKSIHSKTVFILGLLDTLYDEQASFHEVRHILRRILDSLQTMKSDGISVLVTCPDRIIVPAERNQLFTTLRGAVDQVYRLHLDEREHLVLMLEQPEEFAPAGIIRIPESSIMKGDKHHGPHRTNLHQRYR